VRFLEQGLPSCRFSFFVISAAPREIVASALSGNLSPDHIYGTELDFDPRSGEVRASSSDVHVMLHVNNHDGFTIAVSENRQLACIARTTVLSDNAFSVMVPVLESDPRLARRRHTRAARAQRTHAGGLGQGADRPRADRRWAGVGAGNVDSAAGAALPAAAADFARGCWSRSAMMSAWRDPPWLVTGPRALEQHEIALGYRRTGCLERIRRGLVAVCSLCARSAHPRQARGI
jgi:hypothetical protein